MSECYVGEIRMFGFGRTPQGWQACDGSLLPISQYEVLYTLVGTTYGGDGQSTFAVPDLRGRLPVHQGAGPGLSNHVIGQQGGAENATVLLTQMPAHTHTLSVTSGAATAVTPGNTLLPGSVSGDTFYATEVPGATVLPMSALSTTSTGSSQPHDNCMPTLTVQYCIAYEGIYPQQG